MTDDSGFQALRFKAGELPPPSNPFHWLRLTVRQPIDRRAGVFIAALAVLFDWSMRATPASLAWFILVIAVCFGLGVSGRVRNRNALVLLGAVPLFAVWLVVRKSPWLIPLDIFAIVLLLAAAASYARGGSVLALSVPEAVRRAVALSVHFIAAPWFLKRTAGVPVGVRMGKAKPVIRGVALVLPVLFILALLLGSADSVFASIFQVDVDITSLFVHGLLIIVGAWLAAGLFRTTSADEPEPGKVSVRRLGCVEGFTALIAVVILYGVFTVTQVVVWLGGAQEILSNNGLSYAEHARNGFFQLLAVGGITLALLMTMRATVKVETPAQHRWWKSAALMAIVLTVAIVGVALHRLSLYENAYGLTMLRLFSAAFAIWIGLTFVSLRVSFVRGASSGWFVASAAGLGLAILFVLNVVNPEALVVNRNADRLTTSRVPFDTYYASGLSEDSVPALGRVRPRLDDDPALFREHCGDPQQDHGFAGFNLAEQRAIDVIDEICGK